MAILNILEYTTLDETNKCALKLIILTKKLQNLELVNLKYVTYAQTLLLSLSMLSKIAGSKSMQM